MFSRFRFLRRLITRKPGTETSALVVGSTGSGKSEGELVDLVRLADRRDCAVVLLDGHGPLAFAAASHWAARGHEPRIVYEPLDATDRVLGWGVLPRGSFADPARQRLEDAEAREGLSQCFMSQRNLTTLNDRGYTKEWLDAALSLCLSQPEPVPLPSLLAAFRVGTPEYERLLRSCGDPRTVAKFRDVEHVKRRNPVQYELFTSPARRLLELTCGSEVVRLRSRPGPFRWPEALRDRCLVAFDGGGIRSRELKRTVFLLVALAVIHAVRRHFAEARTPLPVVLVLEEAGALGLATPFVQLALQELRKAGVAIHLISQSSLDFGDPAFFQSLLGNAPRQIWYQCLSPADQELGAKALTNATFDPDAVHFTRVRSVPEGKSLASPWRARMRRVIDRYFKSPSLQEQEYRTRLATLRVGERLVRDRTGVRRERVRPLRPPRVPGGFETFTRAVIGRVRERPLYLPPLPPETSWHPEPLPDAAERLRVEAAEAGE
ncbi:MAG TPA: hypothetical protein VD866_19115 [Urbifossiella sp.]|nr:hypothetical protein [Urbifossiella sp.]